jgi:glycosyltransferase involved in cell wall biosynthesis
VRVLLALTYYRPHLSGLTLYVERLATALAGRGHDVTVLASQHDPSLPRESVEGGVRVVRAPVAFWIGKGPVMAAHGRLSTRLLRTHEVVSIHLPQLEAASLALRARALRRPALLTYHCDLLLPPGLVNRAADRVVAGSNFAAAALATRIIAYTTDYAESVPLLRRFREKLEIVPPPVVMAQPDERTVENFRRRHSLVRPDGTLRPVIGMAARLATEKGVDVLVAALPALERRFPDIRVLFAGPYEGIAGEEAYRARLTPAIEALGDRWQFLGPLDPATEMPAFLAALDCLVVPSVNSTESFGLVQVEAMLCGTPVVASALPGVRQVVRTTGMGEIAAVGDAAGLAAGVERVLEAPERYRRPRSEIEQMYDLEATVERYEDLFARSLRTASRGSRTSSRRA